jgi:uncharacterized protein (TIGR03435 family)
VEDTIVTKSIMGIVAVISGCSGGVFGQPATSTPAFDVASLEVSPPIGGQNNFVGMKIDPGRLHIANFGLEAIMIRAYGLAGDQIIGVPNEFRYPLAYEITATYPADTPGELIPLMLQALLVDRFKLVAHRETRVAPVYALVLGKNGPKLKLSDAETMSTRFPRRGHLEYKKVTMAALAARFRPSGLTDRPVLDKTGLTGEYDLVLDWTPDDVTSDEQSAPSLFTAVQEQLGLRLEAQTAPREFLIVDHAQKPAEN